MVLQDQSKKKLSMKEGHNGKTWRCKLDLQYEWCACKLNLQDQL